MPPPRLPVVRPLVLALALACACDRPEPAPRPSSPEDARDMEKPKLVHHAIDYIELTVTDMAEAKRFYSQAFGWSFNDYGPDYAGIQGREREVGGFRLDTDVTSRGALVILYSDDLDASLASVRNAGGVVVTEPYTFPGGRRFHFQDPSGNELAVWAEQ